MAENVGPEIPATLTAISEKETPVVAGENDAGETGEPVAKKRRAVNGAELNLLDNLPAAERYERSYMHRDNVQFVHCTNKTFFVITASVDGHVKFWKKREGGIEFVKHYRAHLGALISTDASHDGIRYASCANDKKLKIFDVINFDMINMITLDYVPSILRWIYSAGSTVMSIAVAEQEGHTIRIYDSTSSTGTVSKVIDQVHNNKAVVTTMCFAPELRVVCSADSQGMIEFWESESPHKYPEHLFDFKYKMQTDMYELAKKKAHVIHVAFSPDGAKYSTYGSDRVIRIFKLRKGKIWRTFNEKLAAITEIQNREELLNEMEFGRRMAIEKDLMKTNNLCRSESLFDETGKFLMYSTLLGIRVISLRTGACLKIIGLTETMRFLSIALFQGSITEDKRSAALSLEMKAAHNPALDENIMDPTIFATAYKKNRFYCFSSREVDTEVIERDIFNEKPTKEETMAAAQTAQARRLASEVCLRTSAGDVYIKLFKDKVPKTVENFVVHTRNGYYNGHIFHRVIKGFMVQTGCPHGTGTGGESIWGGEFEDEIVPELKHKKPFMVSMANAGANTNGSQFFITVCPCPWLDKKHTIFGEIYRGMEIVLKISQSSTNPKTDKPWEDISIISATVIN